MTTLTAKPVVTASDRLGLTLFLAVSLHALILLGISFSSPDRPKNQELINTLDITLVQSRSKKAPDDPDYLAQADQIGGGNTLKKVRVKTPDSKSSMLENPELSKKAQSPSIAKATKTDQKRVLTTSKSDLKVSTEVKTPKKPTQKKRSTKKNL